MSDRKRGKPIDQGKLGESMAMLQQMQEEHDAKVQAKLDHEAGLPTEVRGARDNLVRIMEGRAPEREDPLSRKPPPLAVVATAARGALGSYVKWCNKLAKRCNKHPLEADQKAALKKLIATWKDAAASDALPDIKVLKPLNQAVAKRGVGSFDRWRDYMSHYNAYEDIVLHPWDTEDEHYNSDVTESDTESEDGYDKPVMLNIKDMLEKMKEESARKAVRDPIKEARAAEREELRLRVQRKEVSRYEAERLQNAQLALIAAEKDDLLTWRKSVRKMEVAKHEADMIRKGSDPREVDQERDKEMAATKSEEQLREQAVKEAFAEIKAEREAPYTPIVEEIGPDGEVLAPVLPKPPPPPLLADADADGGGGTDADGESGGAADGPSEVVKNGPSEVVKNEAQKALELKKQQTREATKRDFKDPFSRGGLIESGWIPKRKRKPGEGPRKAGTVAPPMPKAPVGHQAGEMPTGAFPIGDWASAGVNGGGGAGNQPAHVIPEMIAAPPEYSGVKWGQASKDDEEAPSRPKRQPGEPTAAERRARQVKAGRGAKGGGAGGRLSVLRYHYSDQGGMIRAYLILSRPVQSIELDVSILPSTLTVEHLKTRVTQRDFGEYVDTTADETMWYLEDEGTVLRLDLVKAAPKRRGADLWPSLFEGDSWHYMRTGISEEHPYVWSQSDMQVHVTFRVPSGTSMADVTVVLEKVYLKVVVTGRGAMVDGELNHKINLEDSSWYLDSESREIVVVLAKSAKGQTWQRVVAGGIEIDTDDAYHQIMEEEPEGGYATFDELNQHEKRRYIMERELEAAKLSGNTEYQRKVEEDLDHVKTIHVVDHDPRVRKETLDVLRKHDMKANGYLAPDDYNFVEDDMD